MNSIKTTPKDFFLNLAITISVYVTAISLLTLLFEVINTAFPDPLSWSDPYSATLRVAIASLVVVYPLLMVLAWIANKDIAQNPEKQELPIRRWLTYLTLFVAGIAIIIDFIVLLNFFLNGELTSRFILKVLAVLGVSGIVFGYYYYSLKRTITLEYLFNKKFAGGVAIVILASIVGGFFIIGSPMTARDMRFDDRKISDLSTIQSQITYFWQQKERLPQTLNELNDPLVGFTAPVDPQTGEAYKYSVLAPTQFRLCATFNTSGGNQNERYSYAPYGQMNMWIHGAGEECFDRTIDPELFPPVVEKRLIR